MAVIFIRGWDDAAFEDVANDITGQSVGNAVNRTGVGGSLAIQSSVEYKSPVFSGGSRRILGVGFRYSSTPGTGSHFKLYEGNTVHLALRINQGTGALELWRGDLTTLLTTSPSWTGSPAVWRYLEIDATIDDASGSVTIKVDGITILTYSGDTRNGGTGIINAFGLKQIGGTTNYDDLYIDTDTVRGDIVIRTVVPTGNGDSSGLTGSDGNSTDNYLLVDETNSSATDYVGKGSAGRDLYQMGDIPTSYTVIAAQEIAYVAKSDGGTPPTMSFVSKGALGAIRLDTTTIVLSTTYQLLNGDIFTTDPDGNAWTAARINSLQVGIDLS